jgi:hypothetical protein
MTSNSFPSASTRTCLCDAHKLKDELLLLRAVAMSSIKKSLRDIESLQLLRSIQSLRNQLKEAEEAYRLARIKVEELLNRFDSNNYDTVESCPRTSMFKFSKSIKEKIQPKTITNKRLPQQPSSPTSKQLNLLRMISRDIMINTLEKLLAQSNIDIETLCEEQYHQFHSE